jgi:predicted MPP superfamily phosphohydrolase
MNPARAFRKTGIPILLIAVVMGAMWLAGTFFPKYVSRLMGFGVFLLLDIFLWSTFSGFAGKRKRVTAAILKVSYWIPVLLLVFYTAASILWPQDEWSDFFRIYFSGLLVPLFLWKFFLILIMLVGLILSIPLHLLKIGKDKQSKAGRLHPYLAFTIPLAYTFSSAFALLFISGFVFWVYDFKVQKHEIYIMDLPGEFDGYKVVQLSDIHLGNWYSPQPLEKAVQLANEQSPDLVVFTGDLVNYRTSEAYPFADILKKVKAKGGVFAILGNHDYGDYMRWKSEAEHRKNNDDLQVLYADLGWTCLNNEHRYIRKGNDSILIAGVENWSKNAIWGKRGDLKKALDGYSKESTIILLSHDPSHWKAEVLKAYPGIDLTLSGHTHAMQMGWETRFGRWSPSGWLFSEWAGLYESGVEGNKQYLYVNRGLGTIGFPGRIGIRPEITVLVLRRLKAGN